MNVLPADFYSGRLRVRSRNEFGREILRDATLRLNAAMKGEL